MAAQLTFQRVEKKYMLTPAQLTAFWPELMKYMQVDDYGRHTINNIYYDTPDFALIRNSLQKPVYKEKLRLRSYGRTTADSMVFVELKKKFKGIVYKRRESMPLKLAEIYLASGVYPKQHSQILKEIDYFMQLYRPQPAVWLAYDRVALFGKENPDLRLTLDANIRWRNEQMSLAAGDGGRLLPATKGLYLMEVKLPNAMPLWMSRKMAELQIWPVSISKYGSCYQNCLAPALIKENKPTLYNNGGITCA